MIKIIKKFILPVALFSPAVSFAQGVACSTVFTTVGDILKWATCLLSNSVVPLLFAFAMVVFIYGVVKFIRESDSKQKEEGKNFMIWGIIGLFVMVSVWGLVNVLNVTFGVRNVIPQLPVTQ